MRASRSWAVAVWAVAEVLAASSGAQPAPAPVGVSPVGVSPAHVPPASAPAAAVPEALPPASAPAPAAVAAPALAGAAEPASLPLYFTVELGAAGALFADGAALASSAELEAAARAAVARGSFAGAALFGDARSGAAFDAALEVLKQAGFATLVEARRSAPPELSAVARAERARRARQRLVSAGVIEGDTPATPGSSRAPITSARERPAAVELQSVGLYLAGAANTEPARKQLLKLFERNFGAFRRCHADAPEHAENASFGVDLLVPKEGGKAKVRQARTHLAGASFRTCMERAFQSIKFEPLPSGRPEIVSYSVLFRPVKR